MATFSDPITGEDYDPTSTSDWKNMAFMVVGIGITLTLFSIAQNTVVPFLGDIFSIIPGVNTGDAGSGMIRFGNPEG